jgi:hypothetical protein
LLHWCSTLQVLGRGLDVEVDFLLAQINHMAGKQRLAVQFEVFLVLIQKSIQPWQKLLGAVISVQDDRDTIGWCNAADVVGSGDTTSNRGFLAAVGNTLSHNSLEPRDPVNQEMCMYIPFLRNTQIHLETFGG